MAISSSSPYATEAAAMATSNTIPFAKTSPKSSIHTSSKNSDSIDGTADFEGNLNTNDDIPSPKVLQEIQDLPVLDADGKMVPFKDLYCGPNVTRRVLIIFIRHFFCGNCQEYIRTLSQSITPTSLLQLPTPTFIAIIGHGSPSLIPMYVEETSCPFPVYADPTKKLYKALGMLRTLNLGQRPDYQRRETWSLMAASFVKSLKMMKGGMALKGGDYHQVGGEFLFEPCVLETPSPMVGVDEESKRLGHGREAGAAGSLTVAGGEEKKITWCHRMRNTRDHAEIPELREVLGLDGEGVPGKDSKRWTKAVGERKGTGFSEFGKRARSFSGGR